MARNLMCRTRGASYTNFPRNTKQKFLATCAQADKDAQRIDAEVEQAYSEYEPGQVFHSDKMEVADMLRWALNGGFCEPINHRKSLRDLDPLAADLMRLDAVDALVAA